MLHAEALAVMPPERMQAVFGVPSAQDFPRTPDRFSPVDDRSLRPLLQIADGLGARQAWAQQAKGGEAESLNMWAGMITETRRTIADMAGADPTQFDSKMNSWWASFIAQCGGSIKPPGLSETGALDREVAFQLAFPGYPMEATVGFGGTNDPEVSSRALGYIMPALGFAQAFHDVGARPPAVRIFSAHELSAGVNALDEGLAATIAAHTQTALRHFVDRYYPDITDAVRFENPSLKAIEASLGALGINGNSADILQGVVVGDSRLESDVQRLVEYGRRKGSSEAGTATYVLAHAMPEVFGTYVDTAEGVVSVIKFGGPSETDFTKLQWKIASQLAPTGLLARTHFAHGGRGFDGRQIDVTGRSHSTPPYYADQRAGDINLRPDSGEVIGPTPGIKIDRDTRRAADRVGGMEPLTAFMGSITLVGANQ